MNLYEFINAAKWLEEQEPLIYPLIRTNESLNAKTVSELSQLHAGVLTDNLDVVNACTGLDPRSVFLRTHISDENLQSAHGKCRYLVENEEEIKKLDRIVGPFLQEGYMEDSALRVYPDGNGAFTPENIPMFARLIRRSENLAARALFLPFDSNGDLAEQAKDAFSLVKKIRSDMPCMLHAFCFEGLLEPLVQGDEKLLHTLKMLASLNDTSLYASFFIS